jgi:hypothetical protein
MITATNFYRNLGLAIGSLWLIAVGVAFAAWSLIAIGSPLASALLVFLVIAAAALVVIGARLTVSARRLLQYVVADPAQRRSISIRFGLIVATEVVACNLVSAICLRAHRWELIAPLTLMVVGLHFLPLARLFKVPRYYVMGILFCIIPMATLLSVSPAAHIGHALSLIAIPTIGCGLVSLLIASAGLEEVERFLNDPSLSSVWNSAIRSA